MAQGSESLFGSMINYSSSNSLPNGDLFNSNGIRQQHQHDPNSFADLVAQLGFLLGGVNLGSQPTANNYSGMSSLTLMTHRHTFLFSLHCILVSSIGFQSQSNATSWSQTWSSGCPVPPLSQDLLAPIGSSTPIRQTSCADSESSGIGSALNLSLADPAVETPTRSTSNGAHLQRFLSWPLSSTQSGGEAAAQGTYSRKVFVGGLPPDIDEGTLTHSRTHSHYQVALFLCLDNRVGREHHITRTVLMHCDSRVQRR